MKNVLRTGLLVGGLFFYAAFAMVATVAWAELPQRLIEDEIATLGPGPEFDQHVHITVRAKFVAQHRAEEGEPSDVMAAAEVSDTFWRHRNMFAHRICLPQLAFLA